MRSRAASMSSSVTVSMARTGGRSSCSLLQPGTHHLLETGTPNVESTCLVEGLVVVREQVDVLSRERLAKPAQDLPSHATAAISGLRPHVDDVGVAHAVRQHTSGTYPRTIGIFVVDRVDGTIAVAKRALHLRRGAAVIERIGCQRCLERSPIDRVVQRRVLDRQNGSLSSGIDVDSTPRKPSWMRFSASSLSPSKRSTMTGVVLDARARPKPSLYSTRRPSMRITWVAPGNFAVSASFAINWCGERSPQATLSSGVVRLSGSACRGADGSSW